MPTACWCSRTAASSDTACARRCWPSWSAPPVPPEGSPATMPASVSRTAERAARLRGPLLAATAISALFFGGFGAWAALVPLAGAAVASAVVAPEGYRRTVQHLEGGIVHEIAVRDGSEVQAGEILVVLDGAQTRE